MLLGRLVCLGVISKLSSCKGKRQPPGDSMSEHVTRIQKKKKQTKKATHKTQNGGLMIFDTSTIIPTPEKMSTLVIVFEL